MSNNDFFKKEEDIKEEIEIVDSKKDDEIIKSTKSKDDKKEMKYCPYCANELTKKEKELVCEHCDEAFDYVSDSLEINDDQFEELVLLRKGKKYGLWMLISSSIATVITIVAITMTIFYSSANPDGGNIPYYSIIGASFFSWTGTFWSITNGIITSKYNFKAKKLGFKRIMSSYVGMWVSLVGILYGLSFLLMLITKTIQL